MSLSECERFARVLGVELLGRRLDVFINCPRSSHTVLQEDCSPLCQGAQRPDLEDFLNASDPHCPRCFCLQGLAAPGRGSA